MEVKTSSVVLRYLLTSSALTVEKLVVLFSFLFFSFFFLCKMTDLPSLRKKIDSLDTTLVNILSERARVSLDIGAAKKKAT